MEDLHARYGCSGTSSGARHAVGSAPMDLQDGPSAADSKQAECLNVLALAQSQMSITVADPNLYDCPLIACSKDFEKLVGYTTSEVVGSNCCFLNVGLGCDLATRSRIRQCIAGGADFLGVLRNQRKDYTQFMNLSFLTSVFVQGRRYVLGIQTDVTHITIQEGDPRLLKFMVEVAHRLVTADLEQWICSKVYDFANRLLDPPSGEPGREADEPWRELVPPLGEDDQSTATPDSMLGSDCAPFDVTESQSVSSDGKSNDTRSVFDDEVA